MNRITAWILFTFAAVNILATATTYAAGHFDLGMGILKLFLIGAALAGWEKLRE